MYGIPEEFDATRLVGMTLDSLRITVNTMLLSFSGNIEFQVMCPLAYRVGDKLFEDHFPPGDTHLASFIGQVVTSISLASDKELNILFGELGRIDLRDYFDRYESFVIYLDEREIYV